MPRKYTRRSNTSFSPRTTTQTNNVGLIALSMLQNNWDQAMALLRSHLASSRRATTGRRGRIGKVTTITGKAAKAA